MQSITVITYITCAYFKHAYGNGEKLDVFQEVLEGPLTDHDTLWNVAKEKHIPKGLFV